MYDLQTISADQLARVSARAVGVYDVQTINIDQLATVTDRLLLHCRAAKHRPGFLRVPRGSDGAQQRSRVLSVRERRVGLGEWVLATLFLVVAVLSGVVAKQHISRVGFGDAAPHGLRP